MAQRFVKKQNIQTSSFLQSASWARFFEQECVPEDLVEKISHKLIETQKFLSLRFRVFIERNLPKEFWSSPDSRAKELDEYIKNLRTEHFGEDYLKKRHDHFQEWWWLYRPDVRITENELNDVLREIYRIRSKFSHIGESPPAEVIDLFETAQIKFDISRKANRIRFVRAPPSFFWFERVVNEAIRNFLKKFC